MEDLQKEYYFDWAATSPCDEQILKESLEETITNWGNPSSVHTIGKEAKKAFEKAREDCAKALNVPKETLYFTSGGTESDHIPILSVINRPQKGNVLFSSIEHPAVREQALELKKCGFTVNSIPSDKNGIITKEAVMNALKPETLLICVMAVNNETGAIQPIYEIADAINEFYKGKRKAKFHVDCVQAVGKIPLNLSYKGIDSAAFSSHKICGPRGIGLLYLAEPLEAFLKGGGQEKSIRSGTENVFGAIAFSKCLKKYALYEENSKALQRFNEQKKYTTEFLQELAKISSCTIIPHSRLENESNYSPWVVQASFNNIPGQVMLRALDSEGFYISTGSACSSKKNNRPILEAMNLSQKESENAVRFSFGPHTTHDAMLALVKKIKEIDLRFNS